MPDSFTSNRNLVKPQVGSDAGTWGGILNSGLMDQLDLVLGNTEAIAITIADVPLTINQWTNAVIRLTGALTGNRNLLLPLNVNSLTVAVGGLFVVDNQTTGAFNITVLTVVGGSTGVTVPQGVRTWLFSDGTNVWYADDAAAHIVPFNGNPNGFVPGIQGSVNSPPSVVWDYTNGTLYFCITTGNAVSAVWTAQAPAVTGFNTPSNLELNAAAAANILTITALAANTHAAPTAGNPITVPFRSITLVNGAPVNRNITSALFVDTNAIGASLGSVGGGVAFRFWVVALDDTTGLTGKVQLGLINCSTATAINCPSEANLVSSTPMSAGAASAFTIYTQNGVTITNKPWRLLGYVEYANGLVTAGTYNNSPTTVQLLGPGIKRPGEVVQTVFASTSTATGTIGGPTATNLTANLQLTSTPNLVKAMAAGEISNNTINTQSGGQIFRNGATPVSNVGRQAISSGAFTLAQFATTITMLGLDKPNAVAVQTYAVYITTTAGTAVFPETGLLATMILEELMG